MMDENELRELVKLSLDLSWAWDQSARYPNNDYMTGLGITVPQKKLEDFVENLCRRKNE